MPDEEPLLHQLGAYSPEEGTRVSDLLDQHGIHYEIETDQSTLTGSNDFPGLQFGVNPESAKILVFVLEADLARAQALLPPSKK